MDEYLEANPAALANHLAHHYGLADGTASLLRGVLVDMAHELGSALLAIAGALFFGLGFGRVLQSCTRVRGGSSFDAARRTRAATRSCCSSCTGSSRCFSSRRRSSRAARRGRASPSLPAGPRCWLYFAWSPRFLTHGRLAWGDVVPGAALTAVGLVVLMIVSSWVMEVWIDFYAQGLRRLRRRDGDLLLARVQLVRDRRLREPVAGARRAARAPSRSIVNPTFDSAHPGAIESAAGAAHRLGPVIRIYNVTKNGISEIDCASAKTSQTAKVVWETTRGDSYLVLVGKKTGAAYGGFTLNAQLFLPPAISPRQATPIGIRGQVKATTLGATSDDNDPHACSLAGGTVWYAVAPGKATRVVLRLHAEGSSSTCCGSALIGR